LGDLLDWVPPTGATVWLRHGQGFIGWGQAARIDAGTGDGRFRRAAAAFVELSEQADVTDPVSARGSGVVAFGSFTFDPRCPGSVLLVPEVTLARRDGAAWRIVARDWATASPRPSGKARGGASGAGDGPGPLRGLVDAGLALA
jgi:hypothetical protein